MPHPLVELAASLLAEGRGDAFTDGAKDKLRRALIAALPHPDVVDAAADLLRYGGALRDEGKEDAAATLAVMAVTTLPFLKALHGERAQAVAQAAADHRAGRLRDFAGDAAPPPTPNAPPPAGAVKASPLARFTASPPPAKKR